MEDQEALWRKEYIAALREWVRLDSEYKAMLPPVGPPPFVERWVLTQEKLAKIAEAQDRLDAAFKRYKEALTRYQEYMSKKKRAG